MIVLNVHVTAVSRIEPISGMRSYTPIRYLILPLASESRIRSNTARDAWAFGTSVETLPLTPEALEARRARREAFAARLTTRFTARDRQNWEKENVDATPTPEDDAADPTSGNSEDPPNDDDPPSLVGAKTKGGSKEKSTRKPKAKAEVGPSGQAWTPLEKQVRCVLFQFDLCR